MAGGKQECRDYGWSGPKMVAGGADGAPLDLDHGAKYRVYAI
jgi:hypothetical protein